VSDQRKAGKVGLLSLLANAGSIRENKASRSQVLELQSRSFKIKEIVSPRAGREQLTRNDERIEIGRPRFKTVFAIDSSGSMELSLLDDTLKDDLTEITASEPKKIQIAGDIVLQGVRSLTADDSFGVVTYGGIPKTLTRMQELRHTSFETLEQRLQSIEPSGGTNVYKGMKRSLAQFSERGAPQRGTENRVILLTDSHSLLAGNIEEFVEVLQTLSAENMFISIGLLGVDVDIAPDAGIQKVPGIEIFQLSQLA
jgi:hypothetical protein